VAAGTYSTCCLLRCSFVEGHDIIVTTATDGHLGFFDIPEALCDGVANLTCLKKVQAHQSGIPCISAIPVEGTIFAFSINKSRESSVVHRG
jgi:hypothetical protein